MESKKTVNIDVLRYRPEQDEKPVWQSYEVPFTDDMSVLQGLQYIKDYLDGSLSFRWSCRMAICGSCGMMINDTPSLSCQTFIRDIHPQTIKVKALNHFPIQRDLVIEVSDFVEKLESISPYIIPKKDRSLVGRRVPADPEAIGPLSTIQLVHQLHAVLCRLSSIWPQLEIHRSWYSRLAASL